MKKALRALAADIERGESLDACIGRFRSLPPYVAGLIRAAERTGRVGMTLAAWTANRRAARQHWRTIMTALAYPALAVGLAIAVFFLFGTMIVPTFQQMFGEFGLRLPVVTHYVLRTTEVGTRMIPPAAVAIALGALAVRIIGGRSGWSLVVSSVPLIGNPWHWTGVAEMLRGLALLVEHRVPLSEALRLTSRAISDGYVADQCQLLAKRVEAGTSLTMSLVQLRSLPLSIVPLIRCGEQNDSLDASLRSAAEMLENRLRVRSNVLVQIVPPLVFVLVGVSIASAVLALFLPLMSLIQGLS